MADVLMIDIPKFYVEFEKDKEYGYSEKAKKANLCDALYTASKQYCMYCYTRIQIDNCRAGQLDHGIEKNISPDKLTDCVPNIGLACVNCNGKFKRYQENNRVPKETVIKEFEKVHCTKNCTQECVFFLRLKEKYLKNEKAHIILQPSGVKGDNTKQELLLQYDVLETEFIPSKKYKYSENEKKFILDHIKRFHLNAVGDKTRQLIHFIEDTIEQDGHYTKVEYNNLIVELFVKQVLSGKTQEEVLKICTLIYSYSFSKFRT